MSAEADLLRVALALQMGFVTKEQVEDMVGDAPHKSGASLTDRLEAQGHLKPEGKAAIEAYIVAKTEAYQESINELFASMIMQGDMKGFMEGFSFSKEVRETILEWKAEAAPPKPVVPPTVHKVFSDGDETIDNAAPSPQEAGLRESLGEKYEFKKELGRGGSGKVLEAVDSDFGREVAVKMMLPGQSSEAVERFLFEGKAAGRLPHPNIVPIYEIGALKGETGESPYFTMAKIVGRDLREILRALEQENQETRRRFNRPRLLRVFQEVCNAMAFAHDHGVIHRDLKPANVMVGEYGEVFVVDWGLAKVLGQKEVEAGGITRIIEGTPGEPPHLTIDGQIMGTPAYMPPEQADGRIADIDERSDIYSLGAILYEILTFHPPFEGETAHNVISMVLSENVTPPSQRISQIRQHLASNIEQLSIEAIPPELDEIVLKSLSKDKAQRYATARDLSDDIQLFLEGEKELERNHQQAMAKVANGRLLVEKMEKLRSDVKDAEKAAEESAKGIKPFWPAEKKREFWAAQEKVRKLRRQGVERFTQAGNMFQEALGFERRNPEARAALADLFWDRYLREEENGEEAEMIHYEALVRQYNDGQYDDRLKGDGTLKISTRHYPCRCLTEGRKVAPDEMEVMGYHPCSGRALDGHRGLTDFEPKEPIHLKIHGAECKTVALAGADVWLLRFEERDKIIVPRFPEGVTFSGAERGGIPQAVLEGCYDAASPFRPKEALCMGKTPIPKFSIPMGSYLLILHRDGFHPVRCPVYIGRLADEGIDVTLYRDGEIPEGFVQIPAGRFIYQGDRENPYSGPKEIKDIDDAFIAKYPVTCREYLEFINDTATKDPESAARKVPREAPTTGFYWFKDEEGRYQIPTEKWIAEAPGELKRQASKLEYCPVWWEEDWPVSSVSWEDQMAFAAWRTAREGRLFSLPHEIPWEKSARGADGRFYPWGKDMDAAFCNMNQSHEDGTRPTPVDSFPVDESPHGVRGLGGNIRDQNLNDPGEAYPDWRSCRGGFWTAAGLYFRSAYRSGYTPTAVSYNSGGRLSWLPCSKFSMEAAPTGSRSRS